MKPVNFFKVTQLEEAQKAHLSPETDQRLQNNGVNFFEIITEDEWLNQNMEMNLLQLPNDKGQPVLDHLIENTIRKFQAGFTIKPPSASKKKPISKNLALASDEKAPIVTRARASYRRKKANPTIKQKKLTADELQQSVMLVQNDRITSKFLVPLLNNRGFKVQFAGDCTKAVEMLNEISPPKLVILDIMLPFSDGFELIKRIRSRRGWEDVIIMILTSKTHEQDIAQALDTGTNDYVVKQINSRQVIAQVETI